jgi:hypothetical protein
MLSHIIKLQAVVKIVTNETKKCSIWWQNKALRCTMPSIRTSWL